MGTQPDLDTQGYKAVANGALELCAQTRVAEPGQEGSLDIRQMVSALNTSLETVNNLSEFVRQSNLQGFDGPANALAGGGAGLPWLSGASVMVQAVGFATVAAQLQGVRGDVRGLRADLRVQAERLLEAQQEANRHLGDIKDIATRQLDTSEKILATLASSRRVEATQLIEQGWANLLNGYADEARQRFEQSLEYDNTVYLPHAALGDLYEEAGDLDRAEQHLLKAVAFSKGLDAESAGFAVLRLVRFLASHDRAGEACELLAAESSAGTLRAWSFASAEVAASLGLSSLAVTELERAIREDDRAFASALGSVALTGLGQPIVSLLVGIDRSRREPILGAVTALCSTVDRLTAIPDSDESGGRAGEQTAVQEAAGHLLNLTLVTDYRSLSEVGAAVGVLRERVGRLWIRRSIRTSRPQRPACSRGRMRWRT